jgi:hypothetical protein
MTAEWVARLTAIGLIWDQNEAEWEAQLALPAAYKAEHGWPRIRKLTQQLD